jgi:Fungal specific transcription factor domain
MASSDDSGNRYHKEFQFIDAKDKSGRKKSRTHVTKEFYRERRWKQVYKHEASKSPSPEEKSLARPDFVVSVITLDKLQQAQSNTSGSAALERRKSPKAPSHKLDEIKSRLQLPRTGVPDSTWPSPRSLLGAGRLDPFQTYPIESTWEVHQLVDHYHFVIPSLLHKHWGRSISHPMPIMDLFQVYRQDPVPFLGMLHHASHHLAKLKNGETETPQILDYKYRTIKLLNERLAATQGPYDDGTIVGAGLLANAERIWGDKNIARMHWDAVKRMILDRGGFPAFKDNHLVHTKLIWSFIALSGVSPAGNPAFIDSFAESVADEHKSEGTPLKSAFHRSCDEFLDFFVQRKADAIKAIPTSQADSEHHSKFPLRCQSFNPGTRMYVALAQVETGYSSPDKRRAVDNCRMACLLYLNTVIAEYGNFTAKTEKFLETFAHFVEDDDLDCTLSAEHLLWALIRGIEDEPHNERVWMMSRMVGVLKRSDQKTWADVEEALRLFLVMPEDGSELMARLAGWDTESVRVSIMSFSDAAGACWTKSSVADLKESDFLPETRDAQWVSQAQAEAGVDPHPMSAIVLARGSASVYTLRTSPDSDR